MMSIPEILLSNLNLGDLTESEQDAIFEVLRRDLELQRQESERIQNLRAEVNQLHALTAQWHASENREKRCPLCHSEFGWLLNRGDKCCQCNARVCDKCRLSAAVKENWLCTLCFKQMDLKVQSGSWFYSKFSHSKMKVLETRLSRVGQAKTMISTEKDLEHNLQWPSKLCAKTRSVESVIFPKDSDKKLLAELLAKTVSTSSNSLSSNRVKESINQQNILNNYGSDIAGNDVDSPDHPASDRASKHPFRIIFPHLDNSGQELIAREKQKGGNSSSNAIKGISHQPESECQRGQTEWSTTTSRQSAAGYGAKEKIGETAKDVTDLQAKRPDSVSHQVNDDDDKDDDSSDVASDKPEMKVNLLLKSKSKFRNRSGNEERRRENENHLKSQSLPASLVNEHDLDLLIDELVHNEILLSGKASLEGSDSFDMIAERNQKLLISAESVNSDINAASNKRYKLLNKMNQNSKHEAVQTVQPSIKITSVEHCDSELLALNKAKSSDEHQESRSAVNSCSTAEQFYINNFVICDSSSSLLESSEVNSDHLMSTPAIQHSASDHATSERFNQSLKYQEFSNDHSQLNECDEVKLKLEKKNNSLNVLPRDQVYLSEAVKVLRYNISQKVNSDNASTVDAHSSNLKTRLGRSHEKLDAQQQIPIDDLNSLYQKQMVELHDSLSVFVTKKIGSDDLDEEVKASTELDDALIMQSSINLPESCAKQFKHSYIESEFLDTDNSPGIERIRLQSMKRKLGIGERYSESENLGVNCTSPQTKIVLNEVLRFKNVKSVDPEKDKSLKLNQGFQPQRAADSDDDEEMHDGTALTANQKYQKNILHSSKRASLGKFASSSLAITHFTKGHDKKLHEDDAFEEDSVDCIPKNDSKKRKTQSPDNCSKPCFEMADKDISVNRTSSNAEVLFSAKPSLKRTNESLNEAVESVVEFERLSQCDVIPPLSDAVQANISVFGATFRATEELKPCVEQKRSTEETDYVDEARGAIPPVLFVSHQLQEDEDDFEEISKSPSTFESNHSSFQERSDTHARLHLPSAVSQESIVSMYSNSGKGRLGRISIAGEIEAGVKYNNRLSCVEVSVRRCRDLAVADSKKRRTDPYVKTYLLPDKSKSSKRKTVIKKNTVNPVYNEVIRYVLPSSDLERHTVWLSVWHYDRFGRNDFLGDVVIPLNAQTLTEAEPQWHRLEQEAGMKWKSVLSLTSKADLDIALKYVTVDHLSKIKGKQKKPFGELIVTVKMARNLSAVLGDSQCNAFCKCRLLPEQSHYGKQKTRVVRQSLNPTWNHSFVFAGVAFDDLMQSSLELTVWDYDRFNSSEFLGGVRLSLGSCGSNLQGKEWFDANEEEAAVWRSMLDHPNDWTEASIQMRIFME